MQTKAIQAISKVQDLVVFVKGFDKDGLSDLLTNILQKHLNDFTLATIQGYGIQPNGTRKFYAWSSAKTRWVEYNEPCWPHEGKKLLLVPKRIVRKHLLFGPEQYIRAGIVEHIRKENNWEDMSQNDVLANMAKRGNDWRYFYVNEYTKEYPEMLNLYHSVLPIRYRKGDAGMTDDALDTFIYNTI